MQERKFVSEDGRRLGFYLLQKYFKRILKEGEICEQTANLKMQKKKIRKKLNLRPICLSKIDLMCLITCGFRDKNLSTLVNESRQRTKLAIDPENFARLCGIKCRKEKTAAVDVH